jgi:hypothetical protein
LNEEKYSTPDGIKGESVTELPILNPYGIKNIMFFVTDIKSSPQRVSDLTG